jgi:hypothetical protein
MDLVDFRVSAGDL